VESNLVSSRRRRRRRKRSRRRRKRSRRRRKRRRGEGGGEWAENFFDVWVVDFLVFSLKNLKL
jgi:hypothetical protein